MIQSRPPSAEHSENKTASLQPPAPADPTGRSLFRIWLPPALWLGVTFAFSTDLGSSATTHGLVFRILSLLWPGVLKLPLSDQAHIEFLCRKAAHLTEYAMLAVLVYRALRATFTFTNLEAFAWGWTSVAGYALLDEFHQSFVPTRTPSLRDSGIDATGALIGILLYTLVIWSSKSRTPRSLSAH